MPAAAGDRVQERQLAVLPVDDERADSTLLVVADAIGSRAPESREIALRRMAGHGAEIVTTEMVLFEWLRTAEHPQFRPVSKLIR